jgi:hypothetical protein
MANSAAILHKMARNAKMLGLTVNSESQTAVVIENGSNDLTISYLNASFSPAVVGGVDSTVSPYLGIGVGNPGQVVLSSATGTTVPTVLDTEIAAKVLGMLCALANDVIIATDATGATAVARIRGQSDIIGLGQ